MLDNLNFVKGVVRKKKLTPVLSHFSIKDGRITGSNGELTLSAPFMLGIEAQPKADKLASVITSCKGEVKASLTPANRLKLESKNFKAFVECTDDTFPEFLPEGERRELEGDFLSVLKVIKPFIGKDASRPWCNGAILKGNTITATNNVICIQHKVDKAFTDLTINLPSMLVAELVRINEMPTYFQATERSITFHYPGDKWLRSALLTTEWPDVDSLVKRDIAVATKLDAEFFNDVEELKPFAGEERRVFISPRFLGTHSDPEEGARLYKERKIGAAIINIDQLSMLSGVAKKIDFSSWPDKPLPFKGKNIKGVLVGMRYNG